MRGDGCMQLSETVVHPRTKQRVPGGVEGGVDDLPVGIFKNAPRGREEDQLFHRHVVAQAFGASRRLGETISHDRVSKRAADSRSRIKASP